MKNIKRLLGLILAMVLLIGCLPISAFAQETASGTCGDNLTWTLEDGMLTISGNGKMYDYSYPNSPPWSDYTSNIQSVIVQEGVTSIGECAFNSYTNLSNISLPNSLLSIEEGAFYNCTSLSSIALPDNVTHIEPAAFGACTGLESVVFPISLLYLGNCAYDGCTNLTSITFNSDAPTFYMEDCFYNVTATAYYPANNPTWTEDVMQDYGGDITWVAYGGEHTHEYRTDNKCECGAIGGTCGENLIWTLDEEGTLTISGTGDMYYFTDTAAPWINYREQIKTVVVQSGVTNVGGSAFIACKNLTNVTIPDTVVSIEDNAFNRCDSLPHITIPDSVTSIADGAFYHCISLTSITIPNSVTILDSAFGSCSNLTGVTLSNKITYIDDSTFAHSSSLTDITIPDSITDIGDGAFYWCENLTEITFIGNAPAIGTNAFNRVTATAYYPANNRTWTEEIMQDYGGDITWVAYGDDTEKPDITGYSAGLSTTTPTATTGEKVYVSVAVDHAEESTFNAGELVFTYDPAQLSFNQTNSTLGNATVKAANGTLTLEDYGAAKNCGNGIFTLVFDTIADGNATVKLTSAAFSNQENAAASDLIAGVAYPDSVNIVVSKKSFAVTLPDGMTGAATVTDGNSYTFRISDQNYTYSNISATADGKAVSVTDNGDGSYTINSVSGVLKITATRTPKSYKVNFTGSAAADITGAVATATYGTDYKFTIPTANGWAYSLGGITIGGSSYTGYSAEGSVYTIPGTAITGEIVITVNKEQTTASVTVTGSGAGAAAGYDATAEIGKSYTLTITPENGYNYTVTATMGEKSVELTQDSNKYTIAEVTGDIVFTVERTVNISGVTVTEYVSVDGNKVWLIKNTVTLADGKVSTYNGRNMFWSESYDAYCYLVIAATLSEEDAKAAIGIADGSAVAVDYGMDVNMTGNLDANDAQLTYNIYNAYYSTFSETATMEKFLRADVNKDGKVNTTDSAAIINKILNG